MMRLPRHALHGVEHDHGQLGLRLILTSRVTRVTAEPSASPTM